MMDAFKYCEDWIDFLATELPAMCSVEDLVKNGVFSSDQGAYSARKLKTSPPFLRIPGRGISYPRDGVIDWLRKINSNTNKVTK